MVYGTAAGRYTSGGAVQVCARCGARWTVQREPAQWCPRCRAALGPPVAEAPGARRGYRWVARSPVPRRTGRPAPRARTATPAYPDAPRWGLLDPPPQAEPVERDRLTRLGERAPALLTWTAVAFLLASVAELGRYLLLLHNRTRLIDPLLLAFSDVMVLLLSVIAPLTALYAAFACAGWLITARAHAFAAIGRSDPRSKRALLLGCVVPIVNLVLPGVFLTELTAHAPARRRSLVKWWWAAWVFGAAISVAALAWHRARSLQVVADGVLFAAWADLVAAGVAALTLVLLRDIAGDDPLGRRRVPKRWLIATGPARPVIEPIRPSAMKPEEPAREEVTVR